jgi:hypothetical protein
MYVQFEMRSMSQLLANIGILLLGGLELDDKDHLTGNIGTKLR